MAQATSDSVSGSSGLMVKDTSVPLPLKAIAITGDVKGYVLGLSVSLTYENNSEGPVEVVYRMPLDPSQAVVGLTAIIDKRTIRAELKEKQEAKDAYDDAIASGGTAALAEEKSKDVFAISLGNLPSKSEAEIQLELVGDLPIDAEGKVEFSLATTLKQRYTPQGHTDILAPLTGSEKGYFKESPEFKLCVHKKDGISEITSATHSLLTSEEGDTILVKLSDHERLSRNLVVQIAHKSPHVPMAIIEPGRPRKDSGEDEKLDFSNYFAVSVNFFPQLPQNNTAACELIFLVDRSGSMQWLMPSTSESLVLFLKSIPEGCHFNVYGFGSRFVKLFPSSVPYTQEHLDEATSHAQSMRANLGGTEILAPLCEICSLPLIPGMPRQIFILTDGAVSNTTACISHIKSNPHVRCFTFGMGSGASAELVKGMAEAGRGTAEFVMSGERLQPKVTRSLKHALQPSLADVTVSFDVPGNYEILTAPHPVPAVFDGDKLVVYGMIHPGSSQDVVSGAALLKGSLLGEEVVHTVPFDIDFSAVNTDAFMPVHSMAGKALLHDMEQASAAKDNLVQMSKETGVLCKETAFVAVDEAGMELQQPVQAPMVTHGIMPAMAQLCHAQSAMVYNIDIALDRGERLDDLQVRSDALNASAKAFQKSSSSAIGSGFKSMMSSVSGWFSSLISPQPDVATQTQQEVIEGSLAFGDSYNDSDNSSSDNIEQVKPHPHSSTANLPSIVLMQQANGAWSPDSTAKVVGKTVAEISQACPGGCNTTVWATVIVLAVLDSQYGLQRDEWELVAKKAKAWVQRQTLPDNISVDDLFTAAEQFLK